mmetsp:Transcript_27881/g.70044  ORF Transcript_27881/g.70044 Transcript_27881/m.70044 type:complete len:214 (-) Transcript_27881:230-871(-)
MARSVHPSLGRCGVLGLVQLSGSRCRRVAKWILDDTTWPSGRRITQSMALSRSSGASHPVPGSTSTASPNCGNWDLTSAAPASKSSGHRPACPLPCSSIFRQPRSMAPRRWSSAGSSAVGSAMKSRAPRAATASRATSLISTGFVSESPKYGIEPVRRPHAIDGASSGPSTARGSPGRSSTVGSSDTDGGDTRGGLDTACTCTAVRLRARASV